MEVLPSKFRSPPPPKPPRRRYSDQLIVSHSGTFPSSGQKLNDAKKFNIKESDLNLGKGTKCGSLPANWVSDYSSDCKVEKLLENSHCQYVPETYLPHQPSCNKLSIDNANLSKELSRTECPFKDNSERTSDNLSYFEHVFKKRMYSFTDSHRQFLEYFQKSDEGDKYNLSKHSNSKSLSHEYHRRHHSDPVCSFLDKINLKNGLQKPIKSRSSSDASSFDSNNRLCNSSFDFCEMKEAHCLHEEIKNLKEINNKLWQHLCLIQANFEKSSRAADDALESFSISDLLSSLYYSQKAKDAAMEDRMKIVLDERDAAVQELQELVQIIARSFKDDVIQEKLFDTEIINLLKEIEVTYNPAKLLQQQRLLLTYLYHSKELKQDHILHELKLAVTDRDRLTEKVKYLEDELKTLKICNELWNADNKHWENNLLNILCQVIQQRDNAITKTNVTKSYESITSRLSSEGTWPAETLKEDCDTFHDFESSDATSALKSLQMNQHEVLESESHCTEPISDDTRLLEGKLFVLSKALDLEVEKREKAEEKCLRLERLINVLQKKVNGQNVGISV